MELEINFKGKRVVTFKEINEADEGLTGTAKRNFRTNNRHFIEEVDYFIVKPTDLSKDEFRTLEIPNSRGLS